MTTHWTQTEKDALEAVKNFADLADVAITILNRMPQPVAIVCGPITTGGEGSVEKNLAQLNRAVRALEASGISVFDQIPFEKAIDRLSDKTKAYDEDVLEILFKKIFETGIIKKAYFLPDWPSSRGATWERELFQSIGVEVAEYPSELLLLRK